MENEVAEADLLSFADLSHSMSNCHLSSTSLVSKPVMTRTSFCTVHSNSHSVGERKKENWYYCLTLTWDFNSVPSVKATEISLVRSPLS